MNTPSIKKLIFEYKPFNDRLRCCACEKVNADYKIIFNERGFSYEYCLNCLKNGGALYGYMEKNVIANPYYNKCENCNGVLWEQHLFITAIDKSGASGIAYCRECAGSLCKQLGIINGKIFQNDGTLLTDLYLWLRLRIEKLTTRKSIVPSLRHEVFKRARYRCQDCGASKDETRLCIDHIIPVSKGGSDELDNLQCLCYDCNRAKDVRTWEAGK